MGKNKIYLTIVVSAPSAGTQNVNVTIQPLDVNGEMIQGALTDIITENIDGAGWSTWPGFDASVSGNMEYYHLHTTTSATTIKVTL